jgi:hypothetical protein
LEKQFLSINPQQNTPETENTENISTGAIVASWTEVMSGDIQIKDKYAHIENNDESVHVFVYDISQSPNLRLERFFDLKWFFLDARMTDGHLYVLSKMGINWYASAYQREGIDVDVGDFLPNKREIAIVNWTKMQAEWLSDIPSNIKCNEVFYNIPNEETLLEYPITPQVVTLSKIGLTSPEEETKVKVIFGNIETIYLSPTSLYAQNSLYTSYPFWCKDCFWWATYQAGKNTLIHKFDTQDDLAYKTSAILPWIPFDQRSMDEDSGGYLRILNKNPETNLSTNFIIMTPEMEFYSSLQNIQPEKKYQKIQYIDEKIFLFPENPSDAKVVIDLENSHKPKLIGELSLLGDPTQLYAFQAMSGKTQYLLGFGNSPTKTWSGDLKLNFYQINFGAKETIASKCWHLIIEGVEGGIINSCSDAAKKCSPAQLEYEKCANAINPQNIKVELLDTLSFWGNKWYSEVLNDPRTFVVDESGKLLIHVLSQIEEINKLCSKISCITEKKYETLFDGIKVLQLDPWVWMTEIFSKNYQDKLGEEVFPPRLGFLSNFFTYSLQGLFIVLIFWPKQKKSLILEMALMKNNISSSDRPFINIFIISLLLNFFCARRTMFDKRFFQNNWLDDHGF